MNFGNQDFGCDEATSLQIIHSYLDAGHNFIDTANVYSGTLSETIVGKAVKGRRDSTVIATKAGGALGPGPFDGGTSRKHVMKAVEDSLRRSTISSKRPGVPTTTSAPAASAWSWVK